MVARRRNVVTPHCAFALQQLSSPNVTELQPIA
jgi:hypothetical protein